MKSTLVLAISTLSLCSAPAMAQQQSIQDQLVTVYVNLNTSLAKQVDAANAQVADLRKQLSDAQAKCEVPKTEEPKK
jgi:outer membrane protein TolC